MEGGEEPVERGREIDEGCEKDEKDKKVWKRESRKWAFETKRKRNDYLT